MTLINDQENIFHFKQGHIYQINFWTACNKYRSNLSDIKTLKSFFIKFLMQVEVAKHVHLRITFNG